MRHLKPEPKENSFTDHDTLEKLHLERGDILILTVTDPIENKHAQAWTAMMKRMLQEIGIEGVIPVVLQTGMNMHVMKSDGENRLMVEMRNMHAELTDAKQRLNGLEKETGFLRKVRKKADSMRKDLVGVCPDCPHNLDDDGWRLTGMGVNCATCGVLVPEGGQMFQKPDDDE